MYKKKKLARKKHRKNRLRLKAKIQESLLKANPKKKIQPKVKKEEPIVTMDSARDNDPNIVSENIKTREDGSQYKEVEYDDGSMETIEVTGNES